ncbi:hypothetical protein GJ631_09755 [Natronomonas sp. CBA1123]|uniref:hypothetical protein n=1 Tax=Natronomonas sp. CBA1123 TaxID=2668070 RepID=UPI0012E9BA4C|nr:hypothetical protein [Natronomonas sp. CBA1123]MUV86842.1 hypothetical protein [Natronomonas sp. CBA1123]
MTENHDYDTPQEGTLDWHVPLNENFERIDTDVEVRDVQANRDDYTPKQGAKFLATDTGRVYLGDGTDWNELGAFGSAVDSSITEALISGFVVALASNASTPQFVDPDDTSTPVGDAMEILGNGGGGEIRLPPNPVSESETIYPYPDTAITGFGPTVSEISITEPGIGGIRFESSSGVSRVKLDGFGLNGPGLNSESGAAIRHSGGDTQDLYVGRMVFWGWNNAVYRVDEGVGPFQCRHDLLTIYECDAGNEDGLFEFNSWYGPANWFGTIAAYPTSQFSGSNSTVFFTRGGTQTVDYLTMGGTSGTAIHQTWDAQVRFGNVHWEPIGLESTPQRVVLLEGHGPAEIGSVKHVTGVAEYVYELAYDSYNANAPARKWLGPYYERGAEADISENVVNLSSANDSGMQSFYLGDPDDVTVSHSEADTGGLRALGTAGTPMG